MRALIVHNPESKRNIEAIQKAVPYAEVLPAVMVPGCPHLGCALSHQEAISQAIEAGEDRVWVLEDDCLFTPAFSLDRWHAHVELLMSSDFDMLHGGVLKLAGIGRTLDDPGKPERVADGLMGGGQNWSSHCVVYKRSAFWPMVKPQAPTKEFGQVGIPIDIRAGAAKLKALVTVPFMAIQSPGYSSVGRGYFDYAVDFARAEEYLARIDEFDTWDAYMQVTRFQPAVILMTGLRNIDSQDKRQVHMGSPTSLVVNGKHISVPAGDVLVPQTIYALLKSSGRV